MSQEEAEKFSAPRPLLFNGIALSYTPCEEIVQDIITDITIKFCKYNFLQHGCVLWAGCRSRADDPP